MYYSIKMRAAFNSLMVALVVTALFWGNCFSCPQILLAAQKHHCCPHGKTGSSECKTQGLRNFVKAEQTTQTSPAITKLLFLAGILAAPMFGAEVVKPVLERGFTQTVRPFVNQYCVGCHSGTTPAAQLDLKSFGCGYFGTTPK